MKTLALIALLSAGTAYAGTPNPDEATLSGPTCKNFKAAIEKAGNDAQSQPAKADETPEQRMAGVMTKVKASVPPAEFATCSSAMQRALEAYRAKSILVEAKMMLRQISDGISSHYAEASALCPPTKHPVPANLELVAKGAYQSTAADWSDPTWKCASVDPSEVSKQRFQYEIKTSGKKNVEIIARGYPVAGKVTTMARTGTVKGDQIEWSEIVEK